MTAICHRCGERWPRHPALEVECPKCHATVGVGCCRPSGHSGPLIEPHIEREQRVVDEGMLGLCTASAVKDSARPSPSAGERNPADLHTQLDSQPSLLGA